MKRMKKVLSVMLIAVMLLTAAPLSGFVGFEWPEIDLGAVFAPKAEAEETSGYFTYTIEDKIAIITDVDYTVSGTLYIPAILGGYPVKTLGEWAVAGCDSLTAVVVPEGVEEFNRCAFSQCTALRYIILPESLWQIDEHAFWGCDALTNVYFAASPKMWSKVGISSESNDALINATMHFNSTGPDDVSNIPESSSMTWNLTSDGTLTISGTGAMPDFTSHVKAPWYKDGLKIKKVVIEDGITSIGDFAFYYCYNLESIIIPDQVTRIGYLSFFNCSSLTQIELPSNLKIIDEAAFESCSIGSIILPDGLTTIGISAFYPSSLSSINIPASVTSIGELAFASVTSITVDPDNTSYSNDQNGVLFNKDKTVLIQYPRGNEKTSYTIPDGVKTIGNWSFYWCYLTNIIFPESLTTIGEQAFYYCFALTNISLPKGLKNIEYGAFLDCWNLNDITLPDGLKSIGEDAFNGCEGLTSIEIPDSVIFIGNAAFAGCSLVSISLSNSLTEINNFAFSGNPLTSITIPDGIKSIGDGAFKYCESLESVTIPESVVFIGDYSFDDCDSLADVYYAGSETAWNNIEIGEENDSIDYYAVIHFGKVDTDTLAWVVEDDGTLIISGTGPMRDYTNIDRAPWYGQSSKIKRVVIEDGVTSIGDYAFFGCAGFTSIEIADSVIKIGECAFYECQSLSGVSLPANLETIGKSAFFNCKRLTAISIPAKLTDIANDAFIDCKSIAAFTVHEENPVYCSENGVLFNKDKSALVCYPAGKLDTQYSVPDGVHAILDSAFYNCAVLEAITLPDSLRNIGDFAFRNCINLLSLHIPANVNAIGNGAFLNTASMVSITVDSENIYFIAVDNVLYNSVQTDLIYCAPQSVPNEFVVPEDVTSICDFAFDNCTALCLITIGADLLHVGKSAFATCKNLSVVYYASTEGRWDSIDFESYNAPLLDADIHFTQAPSTTYRGLTAYMDDTYFETDSIQYNHYLAKFCALFTVIGYNDNYQKPEIVKRCLEDCGFIVDMDNIVNNASQEQVNYFIAHKGIYVNGENQTLIFAGFIGSHLKQWISNFDPGTGETHKGFTNAKNYVYERLENYIKELGIEKDKTKILLTGHSRGAATCNLVARELIANGKYASPDSIYAYAFATPNSTCLPERKNAEYKRIFNIVNPEDLVTKMIPTAWGGEVGYGRYGTTYTLPSVTNDSSYLSLMNKMQTIYKTMMNEAYHPFPGGEMVTLTLIYHLTMYVKSLDEFYKKLFSWECSEDGQPVSVQKFMTETLCKYKANKVGSQANKEAVNLLKDTCFGFRTSDYLILELTDYFVYYQGIGGTTDGWFLDDYFNEAHSAATYCAYVFSMTEQQLKAERKAHGVTVNCPVDVEIYDNATGELVGRIVNNVVDEEIAAQENAVVMSVDGDSKSFWLPSNGDYEVKLIGNDDGTMDYTISEIDSDIGEVKRVNFFDVEITDGFTMTADMSSEDFVIEEAELVLEDGTTLLPSEIMDEGEITTYSIEITATEGGTAGSSRTVNSGDYVSLSATANEGWEFIGWYENDELISDEAEFAFVAKSDRNLTAKFEQTASSYILGDVDGDGQIASADARSALRAAVGLDTLTETQKKAADINEDGNITASDARGILRCAVGLDMFG